MNAAFALPFRLGDHKKSFLPLDWHCSSGLKALFRREKKNSSASDLSIMTLGSARELRRPLRQVFGRNRLRYTTHTIASPQRAFFHGNYVSVNLRISRTAEEGPVVKWSSSPKRPRTMEASCCNRGRGTISNCLSWVCAARGISFSLNPKTVLQDHFHWQNSYGRHLREIDR